MIFNLVIHCVIFVIIFINMYVSSIIYLLCNECTTKCNFLVVISGGLIGLI